MKRIASLLIAITLLLTIGAAIPQFEPTPSTVMAQTDNTGSMLDAIILFVVALVAISGGLLIRQRT